MTTPRLLLITLCALVLSALSGALASEDSAAPPPIISNDTIELHGTLYGQRFWARIAPPDQRYGGHRVMEILYAPPKPDDIGGTILVDHPLVLLNNRAQVIAWNERSQGLSGAELQGGNYAVIHERTEMVGGALAPTQVRLNQRSNGPAWDAYLSPLLAALTWSPNAGRRSFTALGFYEAADRIPQYPIRINGTTIHLPGDLSVSVDHDEQGRISRLRNSADDTVIFSVSAWISDAQAESEAPVTDD